MPTPLPPNDQPPGWFMPYWLDGRSWMWDGERRRYVIALGNHVVQIVARRGIDWTWRVERMRGFGTGLVSVGGFGFQIARDARQDVLAEFWSDLWTGGAAHERWRHINAQKPLVRRPAIIAERRAWAEEVEAGETTTTRRTEA
jgi:hypothetical protein